MERPGIFSRSESWRISQAHAAAGVFIQALSADIDDLHEICDSVRNSSRCIALRIAAALNLDQLRASLTRVRRFFMLISAA
jgi:hypothetical protein